MLGKLIKHEFKETYKLFGILFAAFILLTVVSRFSLNLPFDNVVSEIVSMIFNAIYFITLFGMSIAITIIVMFRFYNKMMKDEAYLTHTLPVKTWEHIVAKIATYTVWMILGTIMMFISMALYYVGTSEFDLVMKYVDKGVEIIGDYPMVIGSIVFCLILCVLQVVGNLLMYTSALSLGQIFRKHKIAGAVLFYFVINYAMSTISSYLMYLVPGLVDKLSSVEEEVKQAKNIDDIINLVFDTANLMMVYSAIIVILMIGVSFFITNYMLSKKLELE